MRDEGHKIFVGNVPYEVTTDELKEVLLANGMAPVSVRVAEDKETGRGRGFAFVGFSTSGAAAEAMALITGLMLRGRALRADEAHDNRPSQSRPAAPARVEHRSCGSGGGGGGGGGSKAKGGHRDRRGSRDEW
jgi:RNA recognition motif-containing protein